MSVTVRVNNLTISHKGSNGFSIATIPDVCKTPTPGGPVPMPYPNIARSSDLSDGTTTVQADGGNMIAIKGSHYSMSTGDEPGTVGGVTSNTFKKETDWITYSFDVFMDGSNVCRLTDKKFHNHKNTVDAAGDFEVPILGGLSEADLRDIAEKCNESVNQKSGKCPPGPKGKDCTALGTTKHKCCEELIKNHNEQSGGGDPKIASEQGFDGKGNPVSSEAVANARQKASETYSQARDNLTNRYEANNMPAGLARATATRVVRAAGVWKNAFFSNGGAPFIADVCIFNGEPPAMKPNITQAYDFKFNCKTKKNPISAKQRRAYLDNTGVKVRPIAVDGSKC